MKFGIYVLFLEGKVLLWRSVYIFFGWIELMLLWWLLDKEKENKKKLV